MGILGTEQILITTFDTWMPHQASNASDDLLCLLQAQGALPEGCRVLHRLPVCAETAQAQIEQAIAHHPPDYVICCGMAEGRSQLSLEAQASVKQEVLRTPIDLTKLCSMRRELRRTDVSYDAGQFVCNGLYYGLLERFWAIAQQTASRPFPQMASTLPVPPNPVPLFIHVPPLTPENQLDLVLDFQAILHELITHTFESSSREIWH